MLRTNTDDCVRVESQGRPAHPALETLFRQAGACVTQLGLLGVGAAAFADVRKEFVAGERLV